MKEDNNNSNDMQANETSPITVENLSIQVIIIMIIITTIVILLVMA